MNDYLGNRLSVGDEVAIYWGYNSLKTGTVVKIKGNCCKVEVNGVISKWKSGSCMVKLNGVTN